MRIPQSLIDEMIAHAREDDPNECCGMIGGAGGDAVVVHRIANAEASPFRYRMDPQGQYDAWKAIEDAGQEIVAIYHSHTRSAAYPSQTDLNEAEMWPEQVYVIVSLEDTENPDVKGYWLRDRRIAEAELEIA